jgi:MarR family transcriptional regulator for hemolysin
MADMAAIKDVPSRRRDLSFKLIVIARQLRNRFDQSVVKLGITRSQWSLIGVVSHNPDATQRTIAETLEISEAAAGRMIDRLCADGLLEREPREDDRRAYKVRLSTKAQPHFSACADIARENDEQAYAGLTDEQLEQLRIILEQIYRNVTTLK